MNVWIEAIVVGLLVVILGYSIIFGMQSMDLKLHKEFQMGLGLFLIGVITHLLCEWLGINKWYCKHGNACRR